MKMGEESYEMGLNGFSDLSREEFQQLYLSGPVESSTNFECTGSQTPTTVLPSSVDWSEKGMIFLLIKGLFQKFVLRETVLLATLLLLLNRSRP